jgi:hypothetical protein
MNNTCGCAMIGRACLTCSANMAGTWDRYPAPYYKDFTFAKNYLDIDNYTGEYVEDQVSPI